MNYLSFDVGIKNLAYCELTPEKKIIAWGIINMNENPQCCMNLKKPCDKQSSYSLELNNENYELLADSYFIARDRENGIKALQSSLSIKEDEDIAFKIARFGFEDENWVLALKYFNEAKKLGWNKSPGRLELLMGITQYELGNLNESINFFNIALDQDDTKSAAEGWISFVEDIIKNS